MHIRSNQAVRTCLARSTRETRNAFLLRLFVTSWEHVHVLKFHRVVCVTTHMTSLPVEITLFLLSRYWCAGRDNCRKICSSSLDFCKKIAETVQLPLNGQLIFVLLMHYLFIPSTFFPEKSPEQPKHERGVEWARRKSDEKLSDECENPSSNATARH